MNEQFKVLVTGAAGQVGCQLVKRLKGKVQVFAFDRSQLDISNQETVNDTIDKVRPNVIINAAAYTAVDRAEEEPQAADAINHFGPQYLAIAANKVSAALLHISTDYVFSGDVTGAYKETDKTGPICIYGKTKLAGELAVIQHCTQHIILRTAWVFGEHGHNFVKTMLRLGQSKAELDIVSDQFGGPTYAGDIAEALVTLVEKIILKGNIQWGTYHYCGMPYVSWSEFASEIFAEAKKEKVLEDTPKLNPILTIDYPTPTKRPENSRLDCSKILETFNIKPSNWQNALSNIIQYKS